MAGNAPRIFKATNRWGVPYLAVGVSALFSLLAYLSVGTDSSIVFNWLVDFTNCSGFGSCKITLQQSLVSSISPIPQHPSLRIESTANNRPIQGYAA
jgi:hypothetical protein